MASNDSTFSPMAARRLVISRRLKPASTRTRVLPVETNAEFPELLLANMQTLTMILLLRVSDFRYNIRPNKFGQECFWYGLALRYVGSQTAGE
jgi:hypothetical protein